MLQNSFLIRHSSDFFKARRTVLSSLATTFILQPSSAHPAAILAGQTSILPLGHTDLITSLSFNLHGTRLATSSLDHSIRVASLSSSTGQWDDNLSDFRAHDAPVLKVTWGHPEYGTFLASGAVDGVVKVWIEAEGNKSTVGGGGGAAGPVGQGRHWVQKAALTDARGTVRDIGFCPPGFGLKLAAISSDNHLRLWECLEPMTLSDWSLITDIDLSVLPITPSTSTSSSTPGTASLAAAGPSLKGFEAGTSASPIKGATSFTSTSTGSVASSEGRKGGTVESDGGWALSWCQEEWWGERIAVSAGPYGIIRLFHLPDHAPWSNYLNLLPPRATTSLAQVPPTSSLSWAPASGRSYQLLASGSRDGRARVWKLHTPSLEDDGMEEPEWRGELDAELEDAVRGGGVGNVQVEWNVTGTVLSTSGDDGKVRLWKSTFTGRYNAVAILGVEDGNVDK